MGTYNPNDKSTYKLGGLGGLRGLVSTVILGVIIPPPSSGTPGDLRV